MYNEHFGVKVGFGHYLLSFIVGLERSLHVQGQPLSATTMACLFDDGGTITGCDYLYCSPNSNIIK